MKTTILLLFLLIACHNFTYSQTIREYSSFESFEYRLHEKSDTLYIINFWATWCKPCILEMPHFQKIQDEYGNGKMKMILVSLDFGSDYQARVNDFIKKHGLTAEIVILDDPDGNKWIPKVSEEWGGGIPATLIYGKGYRYFFQEMLTFDELNNIVIKHINQ
jgi:thiol-disulfide isomerase/thioredoxin